MIKRLVDFFFDTMDNIDRRVIYCLVAFSLGLPLVFRINLPPAEMETASQFYRAVENLNAEGSAGKIALIAADWGPNTQAENKPQTELAIEHLMRKRIPFAVITIYALASPFLDALPREVARRLERENPGERWTYGVDWINIGYRPGSGVMIQSMAKAKNLKDYWKTDAYGRPLEEIPLMEQINSIKDISMVMEFTGLVGAFNHWIQFFQADGYRPEFVHGCTSITIPEAHIYLSSRQIVGLHEGIAGAAWYDTLLNENFSKRGKEGGVSPALRINTGLAFAHLVIIAFIILGNLGLFREFLAKRRG